MRNCIKSKKEEIPIPWRRKKTFKFVAFEYNWTPKTGRDFIALLYPRSLRTGSLRYPITREKREEVLREWSGGGGREKKRKKGKKKKGKERSTPTFLFERQICVGGKEEERGRPCRHEIVDHIFALERNIPPPPSLLLTRFMKIQVRLLTSVYRRGYTCNVEPPPQP